MTGESESTKLYLQTKFSRDMFDRLRRIRTGEDMNFLKGLLAFIAMLFVSTVLFLLYMKSHDGPIEIFSGGPFQSGTLVTGPEPDWNEIKDLDTFQFQLINPPRSRTTWLAVHEGRLFTPSSYMKSPIGKIWKKWPHQAVKDGSALLRIGDKIYERQMIRIPADSDVVSPVLQEFDRKYHIGTEVEHVKNGNTWLFELAPKR
ncbi:MAG: hypothetical protein ACI9FB_001292 [Candidatus Azotimanducaceae bacterium]